MSGLAFWVPWIYFEKSLPAMLSFDKFFTAWLVAVTSIKPVASTILYAASYAGTVTSLDLQVSEAGTTLKAIASTTACAANPSWLTLDQSKSLLYCADRGLTNPNGTLVSFKKTGNGTLLPLGSLSTIKGGVSSVVYGKDGGRIALASYPASSLEVFSVEDPTEIKRLQSFTYTLSQPGPKPAQDAPHPHEAILDPTGQYVLVPDLGADLVRIFAVDQESYQLKPVTPLNVAVGSGPRHASFLVTKEKTFFFVLAELGNTVTTYEVKYDCNKTLSFEEVFSVGTHGPDNIVPVGAAAAEVHVSPDSEYLIVSSRNVSLFNIPNFDPNNSTDIRSDAIITFKIDQQTGHLNFTQIFPSGGMIPRQFSINKAGTQLAVGLQQDGRAVIIDRDVSTGLLKNFAASISISGEVVCVIFDE
ncbi:putative 6-phosphogluconolactonase [Colletotrichum spaethianum]|uniref:6-phosphogluconolactonase n=1 Tax=Colletotrichum spaethianum TaxID=700344 RepID=A0AA37L8S6_9PEZI|nr:putative 6-phosphogluconolactonase [Colletotrichum spaethianum]GKT41515.1 putative 6-phosphogluconolactonase [Colletotrichum spaethianum]